MRLSDEELIRRVKKWVAENNRLPETKDISAKNGLFSAQTLYVHFGSLYEMYERCGLIEYEKEVDNEEEKPKNTNCWVFKKVEKPLCNGYLDARYKRNNNINRKE